MSVPEHPDPLTIRSQSKYTKMQSFISPKGKHRCKYCNQNLPGSATATADLPEEVIALRR